MRTAYIKKGMMVVHAFINLLMHWYQFRGKALGIRSSAGSGMKNQFSCSGCSIVNKVLLRYE